MAVIFSASPTSPWIGPGTTPDTAGEFGPVATITIGNIDATDQDAHYLRLQSNPVSSIFAHYRINNRYEKDKHIYMMPITSPDGFQGQSVAFAKLAADTLLWIADWTAMKVGEQPEIPNPILSPGQGWILLDEHFEPAAVLPGPNAKTAMYRISGTYVFGKSNPSSNTYQDVKYGLPPFADPGFFTQRDISAAKLKDQILAPF